MEAQTTATSEPKFRTFLYHFTKVLCYIGIAFLLVMMLATVVDVLGRTFLDLPLLGAVEIVEFTMIGTIFFCIGHLQIVGGNISVEILFERLPKKAQNVTSLITTIISAILMAFVAWASVLEMQYLQESGAYTAALMIPQWPLGVIIGIGYAVLTLVLISDIIMLIQNLLGKGEAVQQEASVA